MWTGVGKPENERGENPLGRDKSSEWGVRIPTVMPHEATLVFQVRGIASPVDCQVIFWCKGLAAAAFLWS